jgi:hypothetical protein
MRKRKLQALFSAFLQIAMRRAGPDCLPASFFLLVAVAATYALAQFVTGWVGYGFQPRLILAVLVDLGLSAAFTGVVLRIGGQAARYTQTLTALFGTGVILTLANLPFGMWLDAVPEGSPQPAFALAAVLGLLFWSVMIGGHIYARALSASSAVGLLIAVLYLFINMFVVLPILPELR